jgi:hypothetical protein
MGSNRIGENMAQYNLIRNGLISTPTGGSAGNKSFSDAELSMMYDSVMDTVGIDLTSSDIVYIDIDLMNRIIINEVSLYMSVLGDRATELSNISFLYKNYSSDSYSTLSKTFDSERFYVNDFPETFAPRYIRIIISMVEGTLYETLIYNNDYEVSFGSDGTQTDLELNEYSDYDVLHIFNNSALGTSPVDAFVTVDYQSNELDHYLKLSDSVDGVFKGINDGVGIDAFNNSLYSWEDGEFYGTNKVDNKLKLLPYNYSPSVDLEPSFNTILPVIDQAGETGWGVSQNAWDWHSPGVIYSIGRESTYSSLYLYKYEVSNGTWQIVDEISSGISYGSGTVMSIIGDYVYILTNDGTFGRYDLNGVIGNWESLTSCPYPSISYPCRGMCSDKNRYIYTLVIDSSATDKSFERYDTLTTTWTSMDTGYDINNSSSYNYDTRCSLSYNTDVDFIYLDCGERDYGTNNVQRYYVSSDTWQTDWFAPSVDPRARTQSYYGGHFVYLSHYYSKFLKVYNIYSQETINFNLPFEPIDGVAPYVLCFPDGYGNVLVAVTRLDTGSRIERIYFYNIGRDYFSSSQEGYYTSPIIKVTDRFNSSYLYMDYTTSSGNSVSFNDSGPVNTVMARSDDAQPRNFTKIFTSYHTTLNEYYLVEGDLETGDLNWTFTRIKALDTTYDNIERVLFDSYNGRLILLIRENYSTNSSRFYSYNLKSNTIDYTSSYSTNYIIDSTLLLDIDGVGNIWGYGQNNKILFVMRPDLGALYYSNSGTSDFIFNLVGNRVSGNCWYTDKAIKNVVHIDKDGNTISSKALINPTYICNAANGGCYVFDSGDNKIYYLDYYGAELNSFSVSNYYNVKSLSSDFNNVLEQKLWLLDNDHRVILLNTQGEVLNEIFISSVSYLRGYQNGCIAHSEALNVTYQLDSTGELVRTWDFNNGPVGGKAYASDIAFVDYDEIISKGHHFLKNYTNDPVWSEDQGWKEIDINDNILPAKTYHQFKLKLTSEFDTISPEINKLIVPEPIKITSINPQESKPVYVKVDFPTSAENKEYESKLRCWWGK